jgi:hypothetical protein
VNGNHVIYCNDPAVAYQTFINSVIAENIVTAIDTFGVAFLDIEIRSWVDTGVTTFVEGDPVDIDIRIAAFDSSYSTLISVPDAGYSEPIINLQLGNYGGVSTDHRIYRYPAGVIRSETSVRHTASGYSWKMQPEGYQYQQAYPMRLLVGKVYVAANKLVTVTGWVRRTHTDIKIGLIADKRQLAGMTADYSDEITAAIDTWEQLSFTFTPTEAGVVEIHAYCYGSITEAGYVDDLSITQAS